MRGSGVESPRELIVGDDEYNDVNYMTTRDGGGVEVNCPY